MQSWFNILFFIDSGGRDYYSFWFITSLSGETAFEVDAECFKESVLKRTGSGEGPVSFIVS